MIRADKRHKNVSLEPVLASGSMRALDRLLRAVADKDVIVCLIGESGSGKEVIARRLHDLSARRAKPFVPINCAALPDALFESELFGHERGAFTGANQLARGKVEAATGGTLFLDEIAEIPLAIQAKLLRFLEHRRFMRVGGTVKHQADVRVICATLRPLEAEVARGVFRPDLYYRIQGITFPIPPLRERRADIAPLIEQIVDELTRKHSVAAPRLSRGAKSALREYGWPGNVRELRNVLERLCVLRAGKPVRMEDLPPAIQHAPRGAGDHAGRPARSTATIEIRLDQPLDDTIDEIIRAAVALEGGNRSHAAARLGIGLRTIQRRLASD